MNLLLAVVAGLWYWYAMCRVGYTLQHIFCQPLVMAVPFGLIMGYSTAHLSIPLSLPCSAYLSAIVLALPFGLLGVLMDQIKRFINGY